MADWQGYTLTKKGQALSAKVEAGLCKLELTKMKLGDGAITSEQTLEGLTDLVSPKQIITISSISVDAGRCIVEGVVSNANLDYGYTLRELGLYATDPDDGEILYAVTVDSHPDYLQAKGGVTVVSEALNLTIQISSDSSVTAVIDPNGLLTARDLADHNRSGEAHKVLFDACIKNASISGKQITFTKGDGTTINLTTQDTTYETMTGASASQAGTAGLVPTPAAGKQGAFLRGDGTWAAISTMTGASASASGTSGLVPQPAAGSQGKYLRADGTWQTPPDNDTKYSTFIRSGGSAAAGLVPKPPTTAGATKYLREDGTWTVPPDNNTTYGVVSASANGLMSPAMLSKLNNAGEHGTVVASQYGTNGYRKWSDGFIEQWGIATKSAVNDWDTVNFPISFTTACYTLVAVNTAPTSSPVAAQIPLTIKTYTATNFQWSYYGNAAGWRCGWMAVGY